jgi:hypothetical protein
MYFIQEGSVFRILLLLLNRMHDGGLAPWRRHLITQHGYHSNIYTDDNANPFGREEKERNR